MEYRRGRLGRSQENSKNKQELQAFFGFLFCGKSYRLKTNLEELQVEHYIQETHSTIALKI